MFEIKRVNLTAYKPKHNNMRYFILTLLISCSLSLSAATEYLVVRQKTGDTSFSITTIKEISFDGTGAKILFNDGTCQNYAKGSLVSLRFNAGLSAVDGESFYGGSAILFDGEVISVVGVDCELINVYSLSGALIVSGEGNRLDVSELIEGAYVVQAGSLTSKIIKR